jgi:hypothetical protein
MVGGAIRGFNLPLVLAGLIIGALLMHWRMGTRTIESIDCRRRLPDEAFVGQRFAVRFLVTNRGSWVPAWLLKVDDFVRQAHRHNEAQHVGALGAFSSLLSREGPSSFASCGVGKLLPGRTVVAQYECVVGKRGVYEFGPSSVSTGMPLGLMTARHSVPGVQLLCVFPQLVGLRRDWRRRLQSRSGGMATTARRSGANEGDFFGLRSWRAGDSRRWIHWRTTARVGELAVRQFEQQRRFDVCFLVDAFLPNSNLSSELNSPTPFGQAASQPISPEDAVEWIISAAASLVTQMVPTPTNRVALAVAGEKNACIAGGGNREPLSAMLKVLAEAMPSAEPDLMMAVDHVFRSMGTPQDLVVLSSRPMPPIAEHMTKLLSGRCSMRWYCVGDGTLDGLVERPTKIGNDPLSIEKNALNRETTALAAGLVDGFRTGP